MLRRGRDAGSTHVLEAVIIASIMLSAVAYVATYEEPGTSLAHEAISDALQQRAHDYVEGRFEWPQPEGPCKGESLGEQWLLDAASGRPSSFKAGVEKTFPLGTRANLLLKNGEGTMILHQDFEGYNDAGYAKYSCTPAW